MISYLEGTVESYEEGALEIAVGQVCFELAIPAGHGSEWRVGSERRVYTHLSFAGEKITLYGFTSADERDLFRLLISASKVGPRLALALLSLGASVVARAISTGNARSLTAAKGVGTKVAERLVLELKDKVVEIGAALEVEAGRAPAASYSMEAVEALVQLGFSHHSAVVAVAKAESEAGEGGDTAEIIRAALRHVRSL